MRHFNSKFAGVSIGISILCISAQAPAVDPATASEIQELKGRLKVLEDKEAAAAAAPAAGTTLPDWFKTIELHGFLSTAYVWNFNEPLSNRNQLRVFDFRHNAFRVDDFEFSVLRQVKNPGDTGFRVDLDVGSNIPQVIHSAGLFDTDRDIDLRQAYASYIAPIGKGLTIDIGKYITHFGLEVIEGWPAINDNYSRSFDFGFAIPFTHTGVRLTYPINDQISLMGMVANGWDKVDDNNDGKAFGAQLTWKVTADDTLYFNYLGSPEQAAPNDDRWRQLFGLVWVVKPLPTALSNLTFSGVYDYGNESVPGVSGSAEWHAVEGVLRYDFTPKFYTALRGEWFGDVDGTRTGSAQDLFAVTVTPTYKFSDSFLIRPELRWDHSNKDVFEKDTGKLNNDQFTFAVNGVFTF